MRTDPIYIVFLDIDGVFTNRRIELTHEPHYPMWTKFDPVAVEFFNHIAEKYRDVEFTLMTTWKNHLPDDANVFHILMAMFMNAGFKGKFTNPWRTNPERDKGLEIKDRAYQVKDFLENYYPHVEDYLLFDDTAYQFDEVLGKKRHIKTDEEDGMLVKHMLKAKALMGNWKQKKYGNY